MLFQNASASGASGMIAAMPTTATGVAARGCSHCGGAMRASVGRVGGGRGRIGLARGGSGTAPVRPARRGRPRRGPCRRGQPACAARIGVDGDARSRRGEGRAARVQRRRPTQRMPSRATLLRGLAREDPCSSAASGVARRSASGSSRTAARHRRARPPGANTTAVSAQADQLAEPEEHVLVAGEPADRQASSTTARLRRASAATSAPTSGCRACSCCISPAMSP